MRVFVPVQYMCGTVNNDGYWCCLFLQLICDMLALTHYAFCVCIFYLDAVDVLAAYRQRFVSFPARAAAAGGAISYPRCYMVTTTTWWGITEGMCSLKDRATQVQHMISHIL